MGAEAFDSGTQARLIRPASYDEALAWFRAGQPFPYVYINEHLFPVGAIFRNGELYASLFGGDVPREGWWQAWQSEKHDDGSMLGDFVKAVAFVGGGALGVNALLAAAGAAAAGATAAPAVDAAVEAAQLGGSLEIAPIAPTFAQAAGAGAVDAAVEAAQLGGSLEVLPVAPSATAVAAGALPELLDKAGAALKAVGLTSAAGLKKLFSGSAAVPAGGVAPVQAGLYSGNAGLIFILLLAGGLALAKATDKG